jgi:aminoglycoside phosphotransferase (APT) family kinase protein
MLTWVLRADEFRGMAGADLAALGIPAANDHLRRYAERRGLGAIDPDVWDYHLVYNLFRLAAILQGIAKGRRRYCLLRERARNGRESAASRRTRLELGSRTPWRAIESSVIEKWLH